MSTTRMAADQDLLRDQSVVALVRNMWQENQSLRERVDGFHQDELARARSEISLLKAKNADLEHANSRQEASRAACVPWASGNGSEHRLGEANGAAYAPGTARRLNEGSEHAATDAVVGRREISDDVIHGKDVFPVTLRRSDSLHRVPEGQVPVNFQSDHDLTGAAGSDSGERGMPLLTPAPRINEKRGAKPGNIRNKKKSTKRPSGMIKTTSHGTLEKPPYTKGPWLCRKCPYSAGTRQKIRDHAKTLNGEEQIDELISSEL